ncbi:hypothetical protein BpHYR1_040688 [Brachionus plicatilis]|uniref:Uncharacterized protein n=1 Tax=Brachionus plicatilis TaxID=10195 RepID=A0A3M7Q0E6_BRAPC|nr:hypothetical protein BpHYR1_040688 [Brachionus plicatilis]
MGSDNAQVMCTFGFNKDFRLDLTEAEPRFNFTKADWCLFGSKLDGMITEIKNENLNSIKCLDGTFSESGIDCTEFDTNCYNYAEEFVSKLDYSDDQFSKVLFLEPVKIIDKLKFDCSPGEYGIHNRFRKKLSLKAEVVEVD